MRSSDETTAGERGKLPPRPSPSWPFTAGIPLLLLALFFQSVPLVSGDYRVVLIIALALTALADTLFVHAFRRGGNVARIVSVACLLPTAFVVADFLRRAPFVFLDRVP